MDEIQVFNSPMFGEVRVNEDVNGDVWFCLADVCAALGIVNNRNINSRLRQRGVHTVDTPTQNQFGAVVMQPMTFINEANLYHCIFQSRKAEAEKFQDWVTDDVLPSIRKTGQYAMSTPSYKIENAIARAQRWIEEQQEAQKLAEENRILNKENKVLAIENAQMKPKSDYFDDLVEAENALGFRETAKILSIPPKKFVAFLLDKKYVYRDGEKRLMPYASQVSSGLFVVKERKSHDNSWTGSQTLITTKGRELFRELFNPARISFKNIAAHKSVAQRIKNFFGFNEDELEDVEVVQSDYAE